MTSQFKRKAKGKSIGSTRKKGSCTPIYFEPIAGSGERFTALLVIKLEGSKPKVYPVLHGEIIECLFGENADKVKGQVKFASLPLQQQAEEGLELLPGLSSFFVGKPLASSGNSLFDIANAWLTLFPVMGSSVQSEIEFHQACRLFETD